METTEKNPVDMLAYCGLYCGTCGSYTRGRCKGCKDGGGFSTCAIRLCCNEKEIATCGECDEFENLRECRKLNSFISKIMGFIFKSNRIGNLEEIRRDGVEAFVTRVGSG